MLIVEAPLDVQSILAHENLANGPVMGVLFVMLNLGVVLSQVPQAQVAVGGAGQRVHFGEQLELRRRELIVIKLFHSLNVHLDVEIWHAEVVTTSALASLQGKIGVFLHIPIDALLGRVADVPEEVVVHVRVDVLWQVDALCKRRQCHAVPELGVENLAILNLRAIEVQVLQRKFQERIDQLLFRQRSHRCVFFFLDLLINIHRAG